MLTRITQNEQGLTLIEFLIATVVLTVGLLGTGMTQIVAREQATTAWNSTTALGLAKDLQENLMAKPLDHMDLKDETPAGLESQYEDTFALPGYDVRWYVDTRDDGTKGVRVVVTWARGRGKKSFVLPFLKTPFNS